MPAKEGDSSLRALLALLLLTLAARAVPIYATTAPPSPRDLTPTPRAGSNPFPGDVGLFYRAARLIDDGKNPYVQDQTYSTYPPLWMGVSFAAYRLSPVLGIRFDRFFKVMDVLADMGTTAILFLMALSAGATRRTAAVGASFFALNPVSIIITSLHAPNDPVILFLVVLALWWAGRGRHRLAYLALGMGIAIKVYPVLLVPFFLLQDPSPWRVRLGRLIYVPLPFLVCLIPFLRDPRIVLVQVGSYSGVTDFGYLSVLRTWRILGGYRLGPAPSLYPVALLAGKIIFLLGYGGLLLARRRFGLCKATLGVFLVFLAVYGGISAQYLLWVIPIALLPETGEERRLYVTYSLVAALAILVFYAIFHPGMYFGEFRRPWQVGRLELWVHLLLNVLLWGVTLIWAVRVILPLLAVRASRSEGEGTSGSPR